jgi:hypothetical protein
MINKLTFSLLGLAAMGLFTASQGCSSSNNNGGTGGITGSGGSNLTTDAGDDGANALCTGGALTGAPVVTDFSDVTASSTAGQFTIPNKGGVSGYNGVTVSVANGVLTATGTIPAGTYAGLSIYFNSCFDASAYQGVKFTLSGDLGGCDMYKAGVNFPQDEPVPPASGHGVCDPAGNNCYGPGASYTTATTMISFANMTGGGAVATVTADAQSRITGIGWGFHGPAAVDGGTGGCTVNFTLDDVAFY